MTINDLLQYAVESFINSSYKSNAHSFKVDAEILMGFVLNKPKEFLLTWPNYELTDKEKLEFLNLINRRTKGEPIAYIIKSKDFWTLTLKVNKLTLIPRPATETLVEIALNKHKNLPSKILDLGTGTGAVALALAKERPQSHLTGVDSTEVIKLAQENAKINKITNISFYPSNWFSNVKEKFSIIVSNPPYIKEDDPHLFTGDVQFEPSSALTSGKDGLQDIKHITLNAHNFLIKDGWLLFEHGFDQGKDVRFILKQSKYSQIKTYKDLSGHERVTAGCFNA